MSEIPERVCALFKDLAVLPAVEAWAVAADAIEADDPAVEQLKVGGIVGVLPTTAARSRLPDLERAGINPGASLNDLTDDQRCALAKALRSGRALRMAVPA